MLTHYYNTQEEIVVVAKEGGQLNEYVYKYNQLKSKEILEVMSIDYGNIQETESLKGDLVVRSVYYDYKSYPLMNREILRVKLIDWNDTSIRSMMRGEEEETLVHYHRI